MRKEWILAALVLAPPAAAGEPAASAAWPGGAREALHVPDDLWGRVLSATVPGRRPLGYSGDEMRAYGGREHLLRTVENLFRDVRAVPRETGRLTDDLLRLAGEGKLEEVLQRGWALLDAPAGRNLPVPGKDDWGLSWIPRGASPEEAYAALGRAPEWAAGPAPFAPGPEDLAALAALPEPARRLLVRLAVAGIEAWRWLAAGAVEARRDEGDDPQDVVGPWLDEERGLSVTRADQAFHDLAHLDRPRQAYAAVVFALHLRVALEEWREAAEPPGDLPEGRWTLGTPIGAVEVRGRGDDRIDGATTRAWCVVDLAGNDAWVGRVGPPGAALVRLCVDLGGDDAWDAGEAAFALGCGFGGIGAVVDAGGDDRYAVEGSGLGCAWFGTGLLWDVAGDDEYVVRTRWGQGAAHGGVGLLLDAAGSDRYECAEQSQGMGSTLGVGMLLDLAGDDAYACRDDGNVSELYLGQSVAMAQGCGYGRRADLGDGRSLAGGWGILADGAGDDRYHAQCWAQGCGYWWGVGVLEDRAGDDVYEHGKYAAGAAAHFAVGVLVDLAGDDRHNQGIATTKNQFLGHARDGSIGVFLDGDGDDRYLLRPLCAGCADLGSLALFWDRRGDDLYEVVLDDPATLVGPLGTATTYPPHRSFRDDLPSVGVFLDTGGTDEYRGDPRGAEGPRGGATWVESRGPASHGVGIDEPRWP